MSIASNYTGTSEFIRRLDREYSHSRDLISRRYQIQETKKPKATTMPNSFKAGDWVRVVRNEHSCHSPNREGQMLQAYEGVRVHKFDIRSSNDGRNQPMVFYLVNRSNCYIPAKDVELIEDCICAKPVLKAAGCKCGYLTMIKWKEKDALRRAKSTAANEPNILIPPGPDDND
jgi:hypothetical protein